MPPNTNPAPDPKIATEAKLCAYLEGTLPVSEQAEIEAYLQSNPQHRGLLQELRNTRALLQGLPQESAPPEIAEAFEQQLERSMLLDDLTTEPAGHRAGASQRLLIAGLVLLALGLGVVVYLALPGSNSPTQRLAGVGPITPATDRAPATEAAILPPPSTAPATPTPVIAPLPSTTPVPLPPTPALAPDVASPDDTVAFGLARTLLATTSLTPTQTTLLVLRSNDPAAANAVTNYFHTSVIPFQPVERTAPPATQPTTQATASPKPPSTSPSTMAAAPRMAAFLARSLSPREVARLQTQLTATNGQAAAKLYPPTAWNPAPTTAPAPDIVQADQLLTVTVDQLVGPGVEKTNTVRVNADGTIALPMLLEPIPAVGISLTDLQTRVADRYRTAHLISRPTVHVAPAVDDPAAAGANAPASTEPATPALSTAPANPPESTLDLLVLVVPPV